MPPWKGFAPVASTGAGAKVGDYTSSNYETTLAKNVCAAYALSRRNVLGITHNVSATATVNLVTQAKFSSWLTVPIGHRITTPGTLKVWLLYKLSAAGPTDAMITACGLSKVVRLDQTSATWTSATIYIPYANLSPDGSDPRKLNIGFRQVSANNPTLTIYCVCAYQPASTMGSGYVDMSSANCKIGTADYPIDPLALQCFRWATSAVYDKRSCRSNVYTHWFSTYTKSTATYNANENELGEYKFVKRRGHSEVQMHLRTTSSSANATIKVHLTGLSNEPAEGSAQTDTCDNKDAQGFISFTWTLTGTDASLDMELGLHIDAKDTDTNAVDVSSFSIVESSGAACTHTVPDATLLAPDSKILAAHYDNMKNTLVHLWRRGGRQIVLSDYRCSNTNVLSCDSTVGAHPNEWDKTVVGDPVMASALLFSSTGSRQLRFRIGYCTNSGDLATYTKYIHAQTTETWTNVHDNFIATCQAWDGSDDEIGYTFTTPVSSTHPTAVGGFIPIRAADWEEHYDGANQPPQVILMAKTSNASGYIQPSYVLIEEQVLGEGDF